MPRSDREHALWPFSEKLDAPSPADGDGLAQDAAVVLEDGELAVGQAGLELGKLLPRHPLVLVLGPDKGQDEAGKLGPAPRVKVGQLDVGHLESARVCYCSALTAGYCLIFVGRRGE